MEKKIYNLMKWPEIEGVIYSDIAHPKSVLGSTAVKGGILVQAFYPNAVKAYVKTAGGKLTEMELVDEDGYFAALFSCKNRFEHSFVYEFEDGNTYEMPELYDAPSMLGKREQKNFCEGCCHDAYKFLGAHPTSYKGNEGVLFSVWAPNAARVSVVGNFNNWDGRIHQMEKNDDSGIFELFVPGIKAGDIYKYEIRHRSGQIVLKADPYGFASELRPHTASVVYNPDVYEWNDDKWYAECRSDKYKTKPMAIYEMHLGSYMTPKDGRQFHNYRELAPLIIEHVKRQNYTHVEFMPLMEHPFDPSWGYQVTGYYAPTSRYGSPDDFKFLIDELHNAGIGVILDWVPGHFPKDGFGLAQFDGTCLYEHYDKRKGEHPEWGTLIYNYGRKEVSNFLTSNAVFWIKEYHADGIRMDAVASMLYLDYGKKDGEWLPNIYGGNENLEAVNFLKNLSKTFDKYCDNAILIAEESTAWPKVTGSVKDEESLGFDYKWNMGWMNDFLYFMQCDPLFRKGRYNALTFSMIYAYSEDFILSLSHDEVVHGKKSLINKMPGDSLYEKMANLRAAYAYMYAHPGKKLLFMGQDFAMENEWWEAREIDWYLLDNEDNRRFMKYVADLNAFYKSEPAMYELDFTPDGFEWINGISPDECMVSFVRKASDGEMLLVVANFTPVVREKYALGVPRAGKYKEVFNSDSAAYGGTDKVNKRIISSKKEEIDGRPDSIRITVPPMGVSIFKYTPVTKAKKPTKQEEK